MPDQIQPPPPPIPPPEEFGFQWHITHRCPGRCRHCYQERFDASEELPTDQLLRLADLLLGYFTGPVRLNVTGGEPLLHPGLLSLLLHLRNFSNLNELHLITSGHGGSPQILEKLAALPLRPAIKFSIESHIPEIHDAIRGQGDFERSCKVLRRLHSLGFSITLMTTLSALNYSSIPGLWNLVENHDLKGLILERFVPLGRGTVHHDLAPLDATQWQAVLAMICRLAEVELNPADSCRFKAFWLERSATEPGGLRLHAAECNLGPTSMALMPDGTVYPCRRLPIPIGRLPEDSLPDILQRLQAYVPAEKNKRLSGTCRGCPLDDWAGCRALAWATSSPPRR